MIVTPPPIHLLSHLQSHLFQVTRLPHVQGMLHWSINMSFPVSKLSHLNYSGFIINLDICWVVVQLLSHVWLFATPWTATYQASLSLTTSQSLPKFMSIESVMPFQPSHPQLRSSPSTFNLSQHQGLFKWVGCSHQVAKVLELQLQHQSFQWILRVDFL